MTLKELLAPTYVQMLQALAAWLRKAQAERPGAAADALLLARLAPDMFPLSTQVRFACVQAQEGIFDPPAISWHSSLSVPRCGCVS